MTLGDKSKDPLAELTVAFSEGDVVQVEQLDKAVLASSPMWATVAFLSRERDPATGSMRAPRVSLRRYKKRGGKFVVDKHFTLTNRAQARALIDALHGWFDDGGKGAVDVDDGHDED